MTCPALPRFFGAFVLFSYLGVFAYILTQGWGMAERNQARANEARDELRQMVGFSAADEIAKLDALKSKGSISDQEYARLEPSSSDSGMSASRTKHGRFEMKKTIEAGRQLRSMGGQRHAEGRPAVLIRCDAPVACGVGDSPRKKMNGGFASYVMAY